MNTFQLYLIVRENGATYAQFVHWTQMKLKSKKEKLAMVK